MSDFTLQTRFTKRFNDAFKRSGFSSYSELSRAGGMSRPVTQKIIDGGFDHSPNGPGVFGLKRLADAMGTTIAYLMGEDLTVDTQSQMFFNGAGKSKGTIEKLMETYWRGAGRYEAFEKLLEDCDVYEIPGEHDITPTIARVGKRTLFAGRLGGPFKRDAQAELNNFTEQKRLDVVKFHRRVAEEKTAIGNAFLEHDMVTRPARVCSPNIRLGLLVEDHRGHQSILIHAAPIPA